MISDALGNGTHTHLSLSSQLPNAVVHCMGGCRPNYNVGVVGTTQSGGGSHYIRRQGGAPSHVKDWRKIK
jgi:hypothetical protein